MAIIDECNDNIMLNKLIVNYKLDKPKFMINDRVCIKHNPREIHNRIITFRETWYDGHEKFRKSLNMKVISKFRYSIDDPWWSMLENEHGIRIHILDDALNKYGVKYMYGPKVITI